MSSAPAGTEASIVLPWGDGGRLVLELPPQWSGADVAWPDLAGPIADYPDALGRALDAPDGSDRLEDQVVPGQKVAIVVDDPSRWTPVRAVLPVVLERLHARGIQPGDITISVGVGRHLAVDPRAMRERVGDTIAEAYRCFSPPVDDRGAYVELGTTAEGVPVRIFRPVAEADLRILVGSVLPHLQAGFGGGYKLILPGTSHRTTLGALHRQGLGRGCDAGRLLGGTAAENPMRRAIAAAAGLLGPCFSISHLLGAAGQIFAVQAGHPVRVQDRLANDAQRRFEVPEAVAADLVIAGNHPWPGDPMQSFKVLLQHRAACRKGGVLVGFFWTEPDEIDRSFPRGLLRAIAATGRVGAWAVHHGLTLAERAATATGSPAAFMIRWARELVVDRTILVYAPPLHARIGPRLGPVRLFADQARLWRAAAEALPPSLPCPGGNGPVPAVRIFPQGGLTYVPQRR
jgi:lactate racemase